MRKALKGMAVGAVIGGAVAAPDGAVLGILLGNFTAWLTGAAIVGAVLGGLAGWFWAVFARRMVLPPPESDKSKPAA